MIVGSLIGITLAVATGFSLSSSELLSDALMPYISAFYGIPRIALAPLFVIWFGIGITSKIALVAVVVFFDPWLALVLAALWPPLLLFGYWFSRPLRIGFRRAREANSALTSRIQETLQGIRVIKAYGAEAVEQAVVKEGLEPEKRRFRPHLTLGRASGRALPSVTAPVTAVGESLVVDEIVLFRSELRRSGAIHTPLERIAFGGSDHP